MFFSSSNAGRDAVAEKRRKQAERRKELDEQVAMSKRNHSGNKENCSESLYGQDAQGNTPQTPASPTSEDAGAWTGLPLPGISGQPARSGGLGGYRARGNFMGALSTMMSGETREEAEEKEKKRRKLIDDLNEQVRIKREAKNSARKRQEDKELEELEDFAARGLDRWGQPLAPGSDTKPVQAPRASRRKPRLRPEDALLEPLGGVAAEKERREKEESRFMGSITTMHASDAEIQHKQRQRDILRQQLDEQRREKQAKRDAEKARQQAAEEREERKRVEAGLDIWGRPLPEAEQLRQRVAYEKKMRHKMAAKPAASKAHAVVTAEEMLLDAAAVNEVGDLAVGMRERATAVDSPSESARQQDRIVSTVEELASLCKQLMEEQKDLREQIAHQQKEANSPERKGRRRSDHSEGKGRVREKRGRHHHPGSTHGAVSKEEEEVPARARGGRAGTVPRSTAGSVGLRRKKVTATTTTTTTMANKKKKKTKKKFGEKPSKADQKSFQQRRAEVRAKYAKQSRSGVRERMGGSNVTRPDAVPSVANRLPAQRRRRATAPDKSRLRVESRLVFDYEQGADACAELRTGNTPRGETSNVLRTSKDHGDSIVDHIREDRKQQPMRRRKPKFLEQPTFQFEA